MFLDEFGVQYAERDPVGTESSTGNFSLWSPVILYPISSYVQGSNGNLYESLVASNIGNDPATSPSEWEQVTFVGFWDAAVPYSIGDVVKTSTGNLWKALTATSGNDPESDNGLNWLPAFDDASIVVLEARTTTVIPQTTSGTLTALRNNELQDGGSFGLPLANSVLVNQIITISQPDEFVSFTPVVSAAGGDTITDSDGTDTSITFNNTQSIEITLTSDGVSDWRL